MNLLAMPILCWLIPLLVGGLCAYFGYKYGKSISEEENNTNELDIWKNKVARLEADLE